MRRVDSRPTVEHTMKHDGVDGLQMVHLPLRSHGVWLRLKKSIVGRVILCGERAYSSSNVMSICCLSSDYAAVGGDPVDVLFLSPGVVDVLRP